MAIGVKRGLRIAALVAAALLVGAAVYVHTPAFRHTVERRVTALLAEATGRDVRFSLTSLRPLALSARIEELRIAGRSPESGIYLDVGSAAVDARLLPLLRGRLHLADVSVERVHFDLDQSPEATVESAEPEAPHGVSVDILTKYVRVDRVVINTGRFIYTEPQSGLGFDADGIRIDLERSTGPERYRGSVDIVAGTIGIPDLGKIPLTFATPVELDAETLGLSNMKAKGPGVDLDGSITFTDFVPFRAATAVDLRLQPDRLPVSMPDVASGTIAANGTISFDGSEYDLDLDLSSPEVAWQSWVAHDVTIGLTGTPRAWDSEFTLALQGLDLEGEVHGAPPPGLVPMTARLDLSGTDAGRFVQTATHGSAPPLHGSLRGRLSARAEAFQLDAVDGAFELEANGVRLGDTREAGVNATVAGSLRAGTVQVDRLEARGPGMRVEAEGTGDLDERSDAQVELLIEDAGEALRSVRRLLAGLGVNATIPEGLDDARGRLDLSAALAGPGLRKLTTDVLRGDLTLKVAGLSVASDSGLELDGEIVTTVADGELSLGQAELLAPGIRIELSGGISRSAANRLAFDAEVDTLGRASNAIFAELLLLGVPDPGWPVDIIEPIVGSLRLEGELDGPWNAPSGQAALSVDGLGLVDRPSRALRASAALDAGRLDARADLTGDDNELSAELKAESVVTSPVRGVLNAHVSESAPDWWATLAGQPVDVEGTIEGDVSLALDTRTALVEIDVSDGSFSGTPFDLRDVRLTVSPDELHVTAAELLGFGGRAGVEGTLRNTEPAEPDNEAGLRISAEGIDPGQVLRAVGVTFASGGAVDFQARVAGSLSSPAVDGSVSLRDCSVEGQDLPDLGGPFSYEQGDFVVDAVEPDGESRVRAEGSLRAGVPWELDVSYPLRLDLRALAALPPEAPDSRVDADLRAVLRGEAGDLTTITGTIDVLDTRVQLGAETLTTASGPTIRFADGGARLEHFELVGTTTRLRSEGSLMLDEPGTIAAELTGDAALAPFASLVPDARIDGTASIDIRIAGSATEPSLDGTVTVSDGRFSHPALPASLEQIVGTLAIDRDRFKLENLSMEIGGGEVRGAGEYLISGPQAGTVRAELSGDEVRMQPLEGLRLETDAGLRLEGQIDDTLTLSGRLDVARAAYEQDIEVSEQLLARSRQSTGTTGIGGVLDRIRFNVDIDAPGSAYVRNNIASAETSASLALSGSAADPRLTGRVDLLEGGRWFFRGVTYNITRGTFTYLDSPPGNPTIDLEAETSVSSYDVKLTASGPLIDPRIELISSPSLPEADIVSLLITGQTRDSMSQSGGLSSAQAALYLTRDYTKDMAASLKKSLGVDEIRIDPVLVEGDAEPAARLTVGKAVTGRVTATYSTAIAGNQGDIYQLKFSPRERVSLVGRQDEDSELSGDVLFNRKFYVGPPRSLGPDGSGGESGPRVVDVSIEGNETLKIRRLRRDLGLGKGDRFRKTVLLAGLDAIRDRYVRNGYPEARVEAKSTINGDEVDLNVTVEEGRAVRLILEGFERRRRGLRQELLELWQRSVFEDAIAADAAELVLDRARGKGFAKATVNAELIEGDAGEIALRVAIDGGPRIRVKQVIVEGADAVDEERVREQMLTREAGRLVRGFLSTKVLTQDREAILRLYNSLGYLDAEVGEPDVSYPATADRAVVRMTVEEGRLYRLGRVAWEGTAGLDDEAIIGIVAVEAGEAFIDEKIRGARSGLRRAYDQRGYPDVRVELRTRIDRTTASVDVAFVVDEGEHKTIESVEVAGVSLTRRHVVEQEIDVKPGEPWSADAVAATRQNLYRTGLFKSVGLHQDPGDTPEDHRLRFELREGDNVRTEYGVGASSDDGARGRFSVSHLNLFGTRLYGSTGVRGSQKEWRAFALARKPRLLGTRLQGLLSTFVEKEEEDAFDIRRVGFTLQIDREMKQDRLAWFLGYGLQDSTVSQEGVELSPGAGLPPDLFDAIDLQEESLIRLGNLNAGLVVSTVDDPAWPTRGNVWRAEVSLFDEGLGSEAEFLRSSLQGRYHHKLGSRTVWHVGARVGTADPYGISNFVPISERFFAGGDDTIRGFSNDSIVAVGFPTEALAAAGIVTTESLGGDAQFIFNQELVRPFYGPLSAAVFYDAGNIYWQVEDFDIGDLRHSAGLGLRMRTPIGPLRVEYGWKLDREPDEDRGRLHFSLGMAF